MKKFFDAPEFKSVNEPARWERIFYPDDNFDKASLVFQLNVNIGVHQSFYGKLITAIKNKKITEIANFKKNGNQKDSFIFQLNLQDKSIRDAINSIVSITNSASYSDKYNQLIYYEVGIAKGNARYEDKINFAVKFYISRKDNKNTKKYFRKDNKEHYVREVIVNIHLKNIQDDGCKNLKDFKQAIVDTLIAFNKFFNHDEMLSSLKEIDNDSFSSKLAKKQTIKSAAHTTHESKKKFKYTSKFNYEVLDDQSLTPTSPSPEEATTFSSEEDEKYDTSDKSLPKLAKEENINQSKTDQVYSSRLLASKPIHQELIQLALKLAGQLEGEAKKLALKKISVFENKTLTNSELEHLQLLTLQLQDQRLRLNAKISSLTFSL